MKGGRHITSVFADVQSFGEALARLRELGARDLQAYSPVGLEEWEQCLPRRGSPARWFMLAAAIIGGALAFTMCIGSAEIYGLIAGGKHPASILPYCVIWFELTVLFGGITGLVAIFALGNLRSDAPAPGYDPRFGEDKFGLFVDCSPEQVADVVRVLREAGAEEVHDRPTG